MGTPGSGISYIDLLGDDIDAGKFATGGKASFQLGGKLTQALRGNPDYVVIFMGTNNPMSGQGCFPGWENKLISDLSKKYSYVRSNGAKVIGITLVPPVARWKEKYDLCTQNTELDGEGQEKCARLKCDYTSSRSGRVTPGSGLELRNPDVLYPKALAVNDWIRSNADIVIDAGEALGNADGILPAYDLGDKIHLSSAAHQWIAREILNKINSASKTDDIVRESKEDDDHPGKSCEESHPEVSHDVWVEDQANEASGGGAGGGPNLPLGMSTPTFGRKRREPWEAAGSGYGGAKLVNPSDLGLSGYKSKK